MNTVKVKTTAFCFHCGEDCTQKPVSSGGKTFCCEGCKAVFEVLEKNNLCEYYDIDGEAGLKVKEIPLEKRFDYLDDHDIASRLIEFTDKKISTVSFSMPDIHCSSCVWLLERLSKLNTGIVSSRVDFLQKRISIVFNNDKTSLKEVVKTLVSVGYEPSINLDSANTENHVPKKSFKELYAKIGVAGFCLGNIMLLSFPEYLAVGDTIDPTLQKVFNYLNILLGIPVITYCSSDYFVSAWRGLKNKFINIDLPISLGLLALFLRSVYEIAVHGSPGFMDSLSGLVFFLLVGKLFQSKTYDSINFERDYKSYFPISVTKIDKGQEMFVPVSKIKVGERILIRNSEIIPVDGILFRGEGYIDYSFVTGESIPEQKVLGEIIYAGGRQLGSAVELEVLRTVSQSYLTQLWNDKAFAKGTGSGIKSMTDMISKYFTFAILVIAFGAAAYWYPTDADKALTAFTTVLIIACPCALALTAPFALGNSIRILGKNRFYLRNSGIIESLNKVNEIVFDKTGTISNPKDLSVEFIGGELDTTDLSLVKSAVRNSTHPLSRKICDSIEVPSLLKTIEFKEYPGEGIYALVGDVSIKLGNIRFVLGDVSAMMNKFGSDFRRNTGSTNVFLSINGEIKGFYTFANKYRNGLSDVIETLGKKFKISLISGDNGHEKYLLKKFFGEDKMHFEQMPSDKLKYIRLLQSNGRNVMMIGDGLNDAGALRQSNVGIAITEDASGFSPACDAILEAEQFYRLDKFVDFSKSTMKIIKISFVISFIYNAVGLALAAQGFFSPMIAAILMPFNSISIVLFVIGMTNFAAKRRNLL